MESHLPESTYRLQFHAGFTFQDARRIVPYLHELGITHCYASPILKARSGSAHGYDISDHRVLNPEIGSREDFDAFSDALRAHGMGLILDVVPNHMGITGNENAWWNDVLENGPSSPFAGFFDIDWYPDKPDLHEKVLLPILGEPYGKVLESGQLHLTYGEGTFTIHYYDHRFPVGPHSFLSVLQHRMEELETRLGKESAEWNEYLSIQSALSHLPPKSETDMAKVAERAREKEFCKRRLAALTEASPNIRDFIEENVLLFNGNGNNPRSFDALDDMLNQQAYRLAHWRVAADEINYRRFFDVNDLAALSMEKPEVFEAAHELIHHLIQEGRVAGLRIDHPDGLYDPGQYLKRLQDHLACPPTPLYVIVEKILGRDEAVPEEWPVHGTTGYEFMNMLNGVFVPSAHVDHFSRFYSRFTGQETTFSEMIYQKKYLILQVALSSELHMLAHQLDRLSEKHRWSRDFTLNSLRHALREILACFPVYRSYISDQGVHERDHKYVETAVASAKRKNPAISASIFDFVRDMILLKVRDGASEAEREEQLRFVGKFQQVTAPVTAKGVEDTAFYVYNRLLSLNEVGGDPDRFGVSPAEFHQFNQERQRRFPHALSATTTHDTKRSEDARVRLNVLAELPQEWRKNVSAWAQINRRYRLDTDDGPAPERNEEYLFYQILIAAWPMEWTAAMPTDPSAWNPFVQRIKAYMQKALHEAKVYTSWINPNPPHDEAVDRFVERVLHNSKNKRFFAGFVPFQRRISHFALLNSLAQTVLKITSPGAADTYQGTELWDFSLVDPDNRRPVDYEKRRRMLAELKKACIGTDFDQLSFAEELLRQKNDGRIKLYVTHESLRHRRENPGLFSRGEYRSAWAEGPRKENVIAFVRRQEGQTAIVAVPRWISQLTPQTEVLPLGVDVWQDTALLLPGFEANQCLRNLFTGEVLTIRELYGQPALPLANVFGHFPVALFG